jgi:hypothetical protein
MKSRRGEEEEWGVGEEAGGRGNGRGEELWLSESSPERRGWCAVPFSGPC